jgi:hypothetical protein
VEPVVFRHLKLLNYLQEINLSPQETLALIRRLETDSCRVEDYEVLMRIVRAHTELSVDFLEASPVVESSWPAPQAKSKRQGAKRHRRRHRH